MAEVMTATAVGNATTEPPNGPPRLLAFGMLLARFVILSAAKDLNPSNA